MSEEKPKSFLSSFCPVLNKKSETGEISCGESSNIPSACPVSGKQLNNENKSNNVSACPVMNKDGSVYKNPQQYNVYSQPIDPTNNMPVNPNQLPATNQTAPLSTDRTKSNIPKGGSESDTWLYPSPQMVSS